MSAHRRRFLHIIVVRIHQFLHSRCPFPSHNKIPLIKNINAVRKIIFRLSQTMFILTESVSFGKRAEKNFDGEKDRRSSAGLFLNIVFWFSQNFRFVSHLYWAKKFMIPWHRPVPVYPGSCCFSASHILLYLYKNRAR